MTIYFAISKVVDGKEVLQFVSTWSHKAAFATNANAAAPGAEGMFIIWSWATVEKTITYQVVDVDTLINQIPA